MKVAIVFSWHAETIIIVKLIEDVRPTHFCLSHLMNRAQVWQRTMIFGTDH